MWCRFKVRGAFLNWPCCRQIQFRARSPRGLESFPRAKRLGGRSKLFFFLIVSSRHTFFFLSYWDIHFSWRHTFFLETFNFSRRHTFSNWRHTFFLLETYIFLPCLYPEAIRNNQLGFLLRPILILAFTRKRFPNWHLLLLHFVIWQNLWFCIN